MRRLGGTAVVGDARLVDRMEDQMAAAVAGQIRDCTTTGRLLCHESRWRRSHRHDRETTALKSRREAGIRVGSRREWVVRRFADVLALLVLRWKDADQWVGLKALSVERCQESEYSAANLRAR